MPRYTTSPTRILYEEEVERLYQQAQNPELKKYLAMAWITGARPIELVEVIGSDIGITETELKIRMQNKKMHKTGQFQITERVVNFARGGVWVERFINTVNQKPEDRYLKLSIRRYDALMNGITLRVLGERLSPYHLRHSATTHMVGSMSTPQVMHMQGRRSMASLKEYVHGIPSTIDLSKQNRNRQL